jgi:hypothetical protein
MFSFSISGSRHGVGTQQSYAPTGSDRLLLIKARHAPHFYIQALPLLLDGSASPHEDLRQCSVYGLGVLAAKVCVWARACGHICIDYVGWEGKCVACVLGKPGALLKCTFLAVGNLYWLAVFRAARKYTILWRTCCVRPHCCRPQSSSGQVLGKP